jgi:hypothetical protein
LLCNFCIAHEAPKDETSPDSGGTVATRNETASLPLWQTALAGERRDRRFYELLERTLEGFDYIYLVAGSCVVLCDPSWKLVATEPGG